jgi:hypothetical protein
MERTFARTTQLIHSFVGGVLIMIVLPAAAAFVGDGPPHGTLMGLEEADGHGNAEQERAPDHDDDQQKGHGSPPADSGVRQWCNK